MLRTLSLLGAGALFATTALAAPATCTGAKYLDAATGTCKPCGSRTAKTCSSATVATSCVSRYYLTSDGKCVANNQCPISTFANQSNGKCDKCFLSTYKTCSNGKSSSATSCVAQHCLSAGRCMPFEQIKNTSYCNSNGTVSPCPGQGASTCAVDGTTLSCNAPYFLNATVSAPSTKDSNTVITVRAASTGGSCVSEAGCGRAFYPDSKTRTCAPCGEGVSRCDGTGALACDDGYFLSEGKCVETCAIYQDGVDGVCVDKCDAPYSPGHIYEPFTGHCQDYCYGWGENVEGIIVPPEFPSADGKTCVLCKDDKATFCNQTTGLGSSCVTNYFVTNGTCTKSSAPPVVSCASNPSGSCPTGLYWDCWRKTCVATCKNTATARGGSIVPALWPDSTDMTCKACYGGSNVYRCHDSGRDIGLNAGCFNSYKVDYVDVLPDGRENPRCVSKEECLTPPPYIFYPKGGFSALSSKLPAPFYFEGTCVGNW